MLEQHNCRRFEKIFRALMLLFLVFGLSGCSIKFFYEQIDWLVPWYLDRHLDLSSSQKDDLKKTVISQLRWHRQSQVPIYIGNLNEWQAFLSGPFSRNTFEELSQKSQSYIVVLSKQLLPDISRFLYSLSPEQRLSLYQLIKKNNQDFYDKYLADDIDLSSVRLKESKEAVIFWLGSVNEEQEKSLLVQVAKYQATEPESMKNREKWLLRLKEILASGEEESNKSKQLESLFLSSRESWSEEYQKHFDYNAELSKQLMEEMLKLATPRQKAHLLRRFEKWQEQLKAISEKRDS